MKIFIKGMLFLPLISFALGSLEEGLEEVLTEELNLSSIKIYDYDDISGDYDDISGDNVSITIEPDIEIMLNSEINKSTQIFIGR